MVNIFSQKSHFLNHLNRNQYNIQIYKIIKKQVPKFFTPFLSKRQDGFCPKLEKVVGTKTHLAPLISVSYRKFYFLSKEFY